MSSPLLLIVDDAPAVALIVRRLARHAGQDVHWCSDVPSAWDYLNNGGRADLVLLDHNLPGPSGVELLRQMRTALESPSVPVAIFGSWERPEDLVAGLEAGAEFIAGKDLLATPSAWQQRIREILQGDDGRAAARSVLCQQVRLGPSGTTVLERSVSILESLNCLLRLACVRRMGPDVLWVLMRRAAGSRGISADGWLAGHGAGLDPAWALANLGPDTALVFAPALVEQLWCALGEEVLKPLQTSTSG